MASDTAPVLVDTLTEVFMAGRVEILTEDSRSTCAEWRPPQPDHDRAEEDGGLDTRLRRYGS